MRTPDDSNGDPFRSVERLLENAAEAMDAMMGPYGNVDMQVSRGQSPTESVPVEVTERDDELRVVADLPGVAGDDIDLTVWRRRLRIRAESDRREYDERVRLPARVDTESASASYNNGVLEVTLTLAAANSGTAIDVD
jgi:HSP20 family protein